ncbi:MAG: hypothetical protein WCF80_19565 [Pseudolabrys sp.]
MPRKSHDRLTYPSAPVRVISSSFHAKDAVAGLNTAIVERFGPKIRLLLLAEIAECPRVRYTHDACGAHYVGLV